MRKFEELTPTQVNDLIAEKIMGWSDVIDVKNEGMRFAEVHRLYNGYHFKPYSSLDDCWKAEERLKVMPPFHTDPFLYYYDSYACRLLEIVCPRGDEHFTQERLGLIHATAPQKCEAMLRAIGEIE